MNGGGWSYAGIFLSALALSLGLTPVALRLAVRTGIFDHPGGHKSHDSPIPYLGGAAIFVAFAIAVMITTIVRPPVSGTGEFVAIMGIAIALCLVGLVDDLRGLGAWTRLAVQVGAGVAFWFLGDGAALFSSDVLNAIVTVLWIVGITNAFNLLDNMDGLSAGVAAIAAAWFFVIAASNGQFLVAGLAVALAGCALGFLRHNFHPARIYMGDAGALFLGFVLAVIGVKLRFAGPTQVTFFVPILVLGVAVFDTSLVMATRLIHGRSPLVGGRDHVSHRLVFVGIPVRAAVGLIYGATMALGWLALIMSRVDRPTGFILMGLVLTVSAFLGGLLGVLPVYETSKRRRLMIAAVAEHEEESPNPQARVDIREHAAAPSLRTAGAELPS